MNQNLILNMIKRARPKNPLKFAHDIVRDYAREELDSLILKCNDCEEIGCGPKSLTKGNANSDLMIISESISEVQLSNDPIYPLENTKGFELLQKVLNHYKVNPEEVFYMNTVNCFTHKKVDDKKIPRTPNKKEVDNCKVFLEYAIDIVKPTVIILLGSIALNTFRKDSIMKCRGQWIDVKGIPTMPTYSPQYFIQIEGKVHPDLIAEYKEQFCEDIEKVLLSIQAKYPNNNILLEPIQ